MKQEYIDWIKENVPDYCYGKCAKLTLEMAAAFPELKRVRGHYIIPGWMPHQFPHFWLIASDGSIVDPTVSQFLQYGKGVYLEHNESDPLPTGKCMNCGAYAYDNKYFCSEECHDEVMAEYKNVR